MELSLIFFCSAVQIMKAPCSVLIFSEELLLAVDIMITIRTYMHVFELQNEFSFMWFLLVNLSSVV